MKSDQTSGKNIYATCRIRQCGSVLAEGALVTRPNWMEEMELQISFMPLFLLAIPGTYQSGTFRKYVPNDYYTRAAFVYSQEESIKAQLLFGIRAFDIRFRAVRICSPSRKIRLELIAASTAFHRFHLRVPFVRFRVHPEIPIQIRNLQRPPTGRPQP